MKRVDDVWLERLMQEVTQIPPVPSSRVKRRYDGLFEDIAQRWKDGGRRRVRAIQLMVRFDSSALLNTP